MFYSVYMFKDRRALIELKDLYKDVRNIELYVGGHAEVRNNYLYISVFFPKKFGFPYYS